MRSHWKWLDFVLFQSEFTNCLLKKINQTFIQLPIFFNETLVSDGFHALVKSWVKRASIAVAGEAPELLLASSSFFPAFLFFEGYLILMIYWKLLFDSVQAGPLSLEVDCIGSSSREIFLVITATFFFCCATFPSCSSDL